MKSSVSPSPFRLDGEIALITGGGTGLGLWIARCLRAAGASVVLTGRRKEVLEEAVSSLGNGAAAIPGDITERDWLPELITGVETRFGALSILVNNAGNHLKRPAINTTDEEFYRVIDIHISASFALAREAARVMLPRRKGSVIFIGSMASLLGIPDISAYSAAKTAVTGLARALASEWSEHNVRVNTVIPGWIDIGMARSVLERNPERKAKILSRTPMKKMGSGEDIGWAVVYLCSPAAKFVNGQTLVVDGGAAIGF